MTDVQPDLLDDEDIADAIAALREHFIRGTLLSVPLSAVFGLYARVDIGSVEAGICETALVNWLRARLNAALHGSHPLPDEVMDAVARFLALPNAEEMPILYTREVARLAETYLHLVRADKATVHRAALQGFVRILRPEAAHAALVEEAEALLRYDVMRRAWLGAVVIAGGRAPSGSHDRKRRK